MAEQKPPYKLKIKIDSARADAVGDAFAAIQAIIGDTAVSGNHATTITLESYTEAPLLSVRAEFEKFLYQHKIGMECKIGLESPGIRPEMAETLRATPMEREWQAFADEHNAEIRGTLLGQRVDVKPRVA